MQCISTRSKHGRKRAVIVRVRKLLDRLCNVVSSCSEHASWCIPYKVCIPHQNFTDPASQLVLFSERSVQFLKNLFFREDQAKYLCLSPGFRFCPQPPKKAKEKSRKSGNHEVHSKTRSPAPFLGHGVSAVPSVAQTVGLDISSAG